VEEAIKRNLDVGALTLRGDHDYGTTRLMAFPAETIREYRSYVESSREPEKSPICVSGIPNDHAILPLSPRRRAEGLYGC